MEDTKDVDKIEFEDLTKDTWILKLLIAFLILYFIYLVYTGQQLI